MEYIDREYLVIWKNRNDSDKTLIQTGVDIRTKTYYTADDILRSIKDVIWSVTGEKQDTIEIVSIFKL